jgi:type I restriction enzyme S subunit
VEAPEAEDPTGVAASEFTMLVTSVLVVFWLMSLAAASNAAGALRTLRTRADELTLSFARALFQNVFGDPVSNAGRWPVSTVGEHLAMLEYGPRFYNEAYTESGTRIVRITDLDADGNLRFNDMPRIEVDAKTLETRQLRPGDLIFARSGATVGKVALIPEDAPPCVAGAYFMLPAIRKRIFLSFGRL